ncbi:hypothetical protein SLEP1_g31123 [Rubroshorea leprosula]|uniref:Dehydrin n=1 Tax=Rubroshorea leprosula TaxID=152421 RepID=A0AAV5K2G1_9ROSI|nr:hypothetical protein SLEP1_g31123 [Rubroshorea leprosula]
MADLTDEHGNPVQLTDEYGNPVRLTDEHGNPMQLYGIATSPGKTVGTIAHGGAARSVVKTDTLYGTAPGFGITTTSTVLAPKTLVIMGPLMVGMYGAVPTSYTTNQHQPEGHREIQRSSSSSSSSSEDDGQGGGRKKKGLKQKIKEKLTGKNGDEKQSNSDTANITMTANSTAEGHTADQHHNGHEKKSFVEKIKEKLPGHH